MDRVVASLKVILLLWLAGVGCAGSDAVPDDQGFAAGGITGAVTRGSPLAISSDPALTPDGHTPVGGAEVRVTDIFGDLVGQAVTGPDGAFLVQGVPAGYLEVEVRVDPASADPDVTAEVTGIPGATIAVHKAYPVTRGAAIVAALDGVPSEARVVGSLQPFPAGVTVRPADGNPLTGAPAPPPRESTAPEWFFFVDLQPPARFAHPVEYVFVNANTGAVERIQGVFWPPRVNGRQIWAANHTYVRFGGLRPSEIDFSNLPVDLVAEPTAEVVQAAPEQEPEALLATGSVGSVDSVVSELAHHNIDPASIFAIVFQGSPEASMAADVDKMVKLLVDAGVPRSPNIRVVRSHEDGNTHFLVDSSFTKARWELNALMQDRLDQDLHSTFIVYITSHGTGRSFARYFDEKMSDWDSIEPGLLFLGTTPACRLRVILDFCLSGHFAGALASDLNARPSDLRPDYVIYAACKEDEYAWGWSPTLFHETGAVFTTRMLEYARITGGDITGLLNSDGDGIREELDSIFSWPVFFESSLQHPSAIVRPNVPVRCQEGAPSVCVSESEPNNFVQDANPMGDADCANGALNPTAADGLDIFAKTLASGAWMLELVSGDVELGVQTDDDFTAGEPPIEFDLTAATDVTIWVINGEGPYEFEVRAR